MPMSCGFMHVCRMYIFTYIRYWGGYKGRAGGWNTNLKSASEATFCQSINFDLRLTSKILMKAAREANLAEIQNYYDKLRAILSYLEQLVFPLFHAAFFGVPNQRKAKK